MDHVAIMKRSWGLIPKILDGISVSTLKRTIKWARRKRYCTLIKIDKTGFGAGAAWICVSNIDKIKRPVYRS